VRRHPSAVGHRVADGDGTPSTLHGDPTRQAQVSIYRADHGLDIHDLRLELNY
jgi:hypothetical protein